MLTHRPTPRFLRPIRPPRAGELRFFGIPPLRRVLILLAVLFGFIGWGYSRTPYAWWLHPRVTDRIGLLQGDYRDRHEIMPQLLATSRVST